MALASKIVARAQNRTAVGAADDKSWIGSLRLWAGHPAEGRALLEQARSELLSARAAGETGLRLKDALLLANALLGRRADVEEQAAELLAETKHDAWRAPETEDDIAVAYAVLGDADRALPFVERCLAASYRRSLTPAMLRLDPIWDKIRQDQRFQKLAEAKP